MTYYKIKVLVDKDITACAQMRSKPKDDKWSDFICGVDLAGHLLVANSPQVWGSTFIDLAEEVITSDRNKLRPMHYELKDLDNIEYIKFLDDSQALVRIPAYDDDDDDHYYEELDRVKKEQKEEISKYLERLLRHMTYNESEECWEGYIEIHI